MPSCGVMMSMMKHVGTLILSRIVVEWLSCVGGGSQHIKKVSLKVLHYEDFVLLLFFFGEGHEFVAGTNSSQYKHYSLRIYVANKVRAKSEVLIHILFSGL